MIVVLAVPFFLLFGGIFLLAFTHTSSAHTGASTDPTVSGGWWGAFKRAILITNPIAAGIEMALSWVVTNARGIVSHWALASVKPVARWFDGVTELNRRTYTQIEGLSTDTAESLQKMRHTVIPHAVQVGVAPVRLQAKAAGAKAETAISRTHALSETFTTDHRAQVALNVHYTHAIDVSIPQQLGRIKTRDNAQAKELTDHAGRIGSLEHGAEKTWDWIRTHPYAAVTGAFAGAVAVALEKLGYGFLRCRSWQNLGRSMTCNDANILKDLLIAATVVAGSMSLVELAREEQTIVGDLAPIVRDFWQV